MLAFLIIEIHIINNFGTRLDRQNGIEFNNKSYSRSNNILSHQLHFFRDIKYVLAHNAIFIYLATNFAADLLCFHLIFLGKLFQMISACRLFLWGPWIMEDLFQLSVLLSSVLRSRPISWLLIFRHSALGHLLVYRTMPEMENYNNNGYR